MRFVLRVMRYGAKWLRDRVDGIRLAVARYGGPDGDLLVLRHAPSRYSRRSGDFTANVCGRLAPAVRRARYRLNDGAWCEITHAEPRVPHPLVTVEIAHDRLLEGENRLEFELTTYRGAVRRREISFAYDPSPVAVPARVEWGDGELDVQDGCWEPVRRGETWYVRPRPGEETYDRIVAARGAFEGGRQIATELIFRREKTPGRPFGFGLLPMWGGRPDSAGGSPRRGWSFSLVWYYSKYDAVGMEFSHKDGEAPPAWTANYRSFDLRRDVRYRLKVLCWPERDGDGNHVRHVQRMKWWPAEESEPLDWMEAADTEGATLPPGEYGVALVAHQAQVEFGPVTIEPFRPEGSERGAGR